MERAPSERFTTFSSSIVFTEKVLMHLHPLFLVLCLQMPRKRSSNVFFFCEPSCKQVSFAIYVHMYTSALNSFLHHKTCSKWTAFAAHRKQTNKLLWLLWLSQRRKAQGNRNVQRTENISRYLKTNLEISTTSSYIFKALTKSTNFFRNFKTPREAPFLNVLVLYGHHPNSFRPPPPPCQTGKRG